MKKSEYFKGRKWYSNDEPKPMPIDASPEGIDITIRNINRVTMPRSDDSGTDRGEYYEFLAKCDLHRALCGLGGFKRFHRQDEDDNSWTVEADVRPGCHGFGAREKWSVKKYGWLVLCYGELYFMSKRKQDCIDWLRENVPPYVHDDEPWYSDLPGYDTEQGVYLGDGVYGH